MSIPMAYAVPKACNAIADMAKPPEGFNINQHVRKIQQMRQSFKERSIVKPLFGVEIPIAIEKVGVKMVSGQDLRTAALMVHLFDDGAEYDLKTNPKWNASPDFGNTFYGVVVGAFGYSLDTALKAGAVIQKKTNYNSSYHKDAGNKAKMAYGIAYAFATGKGDNADDTRPIEIGYKYNQIREADPHKDKRANSCLDEFVAQEILRDLDAATNGLPYWYGGTVTLLSGCFGNCDDDYDYVYSTGAIIDNPNNDGPDGGHQEPPKEPSPGGGGDDRDKPAPRDEK